MPASRMMVQGIDFGVVRAEFDLPGAFSAAAQADAENAVDRFGAGRVDETGIAFVTIDPPGSMDLDQAVHIEKTSTGYVVHYAIADRRGSGDAGWRSRHRNPQAGPNLLSPGRFRPAASPSVVGGDRRVCCRTWFAPPRCGGSNSTRRPSRRRGR